MSVHPKTLLTSLLGIVAASCATYGPREPRDVKWPPAFIAEWTTGDSQHPNDSTVWAFRARGSLDVFRRTVRVHDGRPLVEQHRVRHLYWWTEPLGNAGARKLCHTARPGRNGPSCMKYEFGSRTDSTGYVRRTLSLTGLKWNFRAVFAERR